MRSICNLTTRGIIGLMLVAGLTGCDALEVFDRDQEITGVVEVIGENSITVDGIVYRVTSDTEFEGIEGLSELSVGDEVDIEYEGDGQERTALEIEFGEEEDDDGGILG